MRLFKNIKKKSPHYRHLSNKWVQRHATLKENIRQKHKDSLEWIGTNFPGKEQL